MNNLRIIYMIFILFASSVSASDVKIIELHSSKSLDQLVLDSTNEANDNKTEILDNTNENLPDDQKLIEDETAQKNEESNDQDPEDISNKEIVDKALLWGALWIYLADKKFSKQEQEKFSNRFGDKATVSIKSLLNISKISVIEKKVMEAYALASTLLKSEKEKIITKIKEIYSEADEHNDKSKEVLEKIIKLLK